MSSAALPSSRARDQAELPRRIEPGRPLGRAAGNPIVLDSEARDPRASVLIDYLPSHKRNRCCVVRLRSARALRIETTGNRQPKYRSGQPSVSTDCRIGNCSAPLNVAALEIIGGNMIGNLYQAQLDHIAWTIGRMIDAADKLSEEEFSRVSDVGPYPGSVKFFISHLIGTHFFYADIFSGKHERECRSRVEFEDMTRAELRRLLPLADAEMRHALASYLRKRPLTEELEWQWCGARINGVTALIHMVYHSAYHSAECAEVLRSMNCVVPELWPITWAGERNLIVPSGYMF